MECLNCVSTMVIRGSPGHRRCYCCNCGSIFIESGKTWHMANTTGNNAIRGYLELENDAEKEENGDEINVANY